MIKMENMANFKSLINSIKGLFRCKIGIKGKNNKIRKPRMKMIKMKKFEIPINSIRGVN
jgi:hypothetical protein